jgi:hypothetical protein
MALKLSNALSNFGRYEICVSQCAIEISRIALRSKKTSIVSSPTSLTGSEEGDIEFFIKFIIVGWGEKGGPGRIGKSRLRAQRPAKEVHLFLALKAQQVQRT